MNSNGNMQRSMSSPAHVQQQGVTDQQPEEAKKEEQSQVVASGHPEQGSIGVIETKEEEKQPIATQEAAFVQALQPVEVVLPPEVKEVGVEQGEDVRAQQDLPQVIKDAGVHLIKEATPFETTPVSMNTNLPWSEQEALVVKEKHKRKWKDAIRWLAELVLYQWQQKGER
jgi:hypothetical protein